VCESMHGGVRGRGSNPPTYSIDYVDDIDGDKDEFGKIYVCFAGSGFAYGVEKFNL